MIRGRCSLQEAIREGLSKPVVAPKNIGTKSEPINQDRHVIYREIEKFFNISFTGINKILQEHLAVKNICSRWISHNLANVY